MDRRRFLELFAGVSVSALPGFRAAGGGNRVVVAGGGIVGSSIAYHLARRGAEVTLFEKSRPSAGATEKSFAWINATFGKRPRHYYELNRMGMEAYRHLDDELRGELGIRWGGSLEWYGDPREAQELRLQVRRHQVWGYPTRLIEEAEFHRLEGSLEPGRVLAAAHSEQEGHVDPVHAVDVYLKKAQAQGARVTFPAEITGVDIRGGRLAGVETTVGSVEADVLVVACGVDTPRLAATAGLDVPLKDSPGLLAHTPPLPALVNRVVLAPGAHMKQKLDGRLVTGAGFGGSPTTDASGENGERILAEAARFLPALEGAGVEKVTLGFRPLPKDDHPIVGFCEGSPGIYLAVMHSGVTLSALIGRLSAMEILDGVSVDLLSPYRLSRFRTS
jgi:glycine/D-amino acid oxidase-like deaminating enzyme